MIGLDSGGEFRRRPILAALCLAFSGTVENILYSKEEEAWENVYAVGSTVFICPRNG